MILDRTISTIENHQGGTKVNWFWKTQILNNRFVDVIPALAVTAKQLLPTIKTFTTLNLYAYADATLYGNTVQQELQMEDAANPNDKSSRSNRCYLSTTVGLISQNNLRMVTAVTMDINSRCQQLFITKKIMKAKS